MLLRSRAEDCEGPATQFLLYTKPERLALTLERNFSRHF